MGRDKKRDFQSLGKDEEDDQPSQTNPKSICNDFLTGSETESVIVPKNFSPEIWSEMKVSLHRMCGEEFDRLFKSYLRHCLPQSSSNSQLVGHNEEATEVAGFKTKLKLCFFNQLPSTIYTNNEIEAENGEPLQVALIDVNNFIVSMGPLSMAQLEFVVLDGDSDEFDDKRILPQRNDKRPLLVGNDLKLYLKEGVGIIKSLSFTDNSSWVRSRNFQLGIRVSDAKILAKFTRIEAAISRPFRVLEHRGEVNKKHHPPKKEDKVWRLEGISKDGVYHKKLSSAGIETVGDFLRIYNEHGDLYLKKLFGKKVSKKMRDAMVNNALECVPIVNFASSFEMQNFVGSEAMGSGDKASVGTKGNKKRDSNEDNKLLETTHAEVDEGWEKPMLNFEGITINDRFPS